MDDNGLLEPSFADAIAAIEQSGELPPSRRTHWVCSLRQIAKALGRPPESIAARWGAVALKGQPASSRRQRRRMEDVGQPQVECEGCFTLVSKGQ
jgi:hypothetical protein